MRILIVDDRPLGVRVLREEILESEPTYEVEGATTADEARRRVQEAKTPFDVFLVDQNLGLGPDGIELMVELRQFSPRSDLMVFTGDDDLKSKQRAIEAGACDYFTKPLDQPRLLAQLHRLQRERSMRDERNWLATLAEVGKELQSRTTVKDVGQIIVQAAPRLGFERARLWLFKQETQELVGLCEKGNIGLQDFEGLSIPLSKMPYSHHALKVGEPVFFKGNEFGQSELVSRFNSRGFRVAIGERVKIPLLVSEIWIGVLTLDNADRPQTYTSEERGLLQLLGNQAASALERARLQQQADEQARTQALLSQVTFAVTEQVAQGNLDNLLDVLRNQLRDCLHFDVDYFAIVLLDPREPTSRYLDFYCEYKHGERQIRHWCAYPDDPATEWIVRGIEDMRTAGDLPPGRLVVPLIVSEEIIGAIVLQSESTSAVFNTTQRDQLVAVAQHVSGIIKSVYFAGRAKEHSLRKDHHAKLIRKLQQLARADENHFWHAILTFATHHEGLGFNRAVLFRYGAEGRAIQGRMGIGHFNRENAWRNWKENEKKTFDDYLMAPYFGSLHTTPLATAVLDWVQPLKDDARNPFHRVQVEKTSLKFPGVELQAWLPEPAFIPKEMPLSARCALIPWKDGDKVVGVLLVDNAMDDKPVWQEDLAALEDLLAQASQILGATGEVTHLRRQGESYEMILKLSQQLMAQANDVDLRELLGRLCQEALSITKADFVVLYPLGPDGASYDTRYIIVEGTPFDKDYLFKTKPRQKGVAAHVLQSHTLIVNDVKQSSLEFDGLPLSKQHYIEREQVAAFIGVSIRTATSPTSLGVLYFDYRQRRSFSESEVLQAEQLAGVAEMVIGSANLVEQEAERYALQESNSLQAIQKASLASDTSEEKVILVVLSQARELFGRYVGLILARHRWQPVEGKEEVQEVFHYYKLDSPLENCQRVDPPDPDKANMEKAFRSGKPFKTNDTLAVPIKTDYHSIGCMSITGLGDSPPFRVERLANAAALALDNVRRQERLRTVLEAARLVVAQREFGKTLEAVIQVLGKVSPGLNCVTVWCSDPARATHLLVRHWGLLEDSQDARDPGGALSQTQHDIVNLVVKSASPIWADDVSAPSTPLELRESRFVTRQKIISTAALPLKVQEEYVGALFFNYRHPHRFTPGEKNTFPTIAAIIAESIHEAQLLERAEREEKRAKVDEERFAAALNVVDTVGTELDLDKVLRRVLMALRKHFNKPDASVQPYVMLYDKADDVLELPAVAREFDPVDNPKYREQLRLPLDGSQKGIVCRIARKSRDLGDIFVDSIDDVKGDPDCLPFNSKTESLLCAGLTNKEQQTGKSRLWGVLAISSPVKKAFDDQDKLLLELTAQQALIAMERAEQAAKLRFKDAVSSVTTWAAELAHDINKEVGAIRSRAYWLRNEQSLSDQGRQWAQEIDAGAARLVDVTRSVRTDQQKDIQTFDLCQMLSGRITDLASQRWPAIKIVTEFDTPEVLLYSYSERLWRGVRHLVRNAADAMKGDGVLTIRTRHRGDKIEIQIEDTGPGVSAKLRSILLEQPSSSKGTLQDHGYGLLIARQLVESLGGQVRILPQESGRGAIFALTLPLTPERLS